MSRDLKFHPERQALTNELHARPFQPMTAPGRILHLAFAPQHDASGRDPARDAAHLEALLDAHGAPRPAVGARHHVADLGAVSLKWERHTEFVAYTFYEAGPSTALFTGALLDALDRDWLSRAPGAVIAAIDLELVAASDQAAAETMLSGPLGAAFDGESLAVGRVLDDAGMALGDFRLHAGGVTRFAIVVSGETGPRRVGRICQRLIEIEVYRLMAMLALTPARETAGRLNAIERVLADLIGLVKLDEQSAPEREILAALTEISAEIETISAETAFRFSAARAYEAIVHERIEMLREGRVSGRQQFQEFMLRRFDPAMRTVRAAETRLDAVSARTARVADLLRTRVNVALEAQNQAVLQSMDRRAALQLRLQQTVEGLSVVAISYYAVSLLSYLLAPMGAALGIGKTLLTALVTVPVVGLTWYMIRRLRKRLEGE